MICGSSPVRLNRARCARPNRSIACTLERAPFRLPNGVRTASTITTSSLAFAMSYNSLGGRHAGAARKRRGGEIDGNCRAHQTPPTVTFQLVGIGIVSGSLLDVILAVLPICR